MAKCRCRENRRSAFRKPGRFTDTGSCARATGSLQPQDVVVELYLGRVDTRGEIIEGHATEMRAEANSSDDRIYTGETTPTESGLHGFTIRVRPSHPDLSTALVPGLIAWAMEDALQQSLAREATQLCLTVLRGTCRRRSHCLTTCRHKRCSRRSRSAIHPLCCPSKKEDARKMWRRPAPSRSAFAPAAR